MPLYDYAPKSGKCSKCHGRFEVVQRVAEPKLKTCPDCGKAVERLVSAAAVHGKFSTKSDSKLKDLGLTKGEFAVLRRLSSPEKIQRYLLDMYQNFELNGDSCASVRMVLRDKNHPSVVIWSNGMSHP